MKTRWLRTIPFILLLQIVVRSQAENVSINVNLFSNDKARFILMDAIDDYGHQNQRILDQDQEAVRISRDISPNKFYSEKSERTKRQVSRYSYQQYLENIGRADYDMRSEEGWEDILYPFGHWAYDRELMGQAGRETQANLACDFPYFGYRFNYTFVYPSGFVSFGRPSFMAPPFTFPNPRWPSQRDHSFIAPYYADSMFQWIGNTKLSNVFFRSVHRPTFGGNPWFDPFNPFQNPSGEYGSGQTYNRPPSVNPGTGNTRGSPPTNNNPFLNQRQSANPYNQQTYGTGNFGGGKRRKRQTPSRSNQPGMVTDPLLLDNITRHIQDGYTGANGFIAQHAFIVTWYRMAYGGAPRALDVSQFEHIKQWQNTFQLVLATDEIRSFAIFNYARLNWTTSNMAGGLNGFGGHQAAMAGFNGGNGTGWYPLPYSGHGRIWKLGYFSNVLMPGRWIHRVDEQIIPGGCTNASKGRIVTSPPFGPMQGGVAINISGPCFRPNDFVKVNFENWEVNCARLNRIRARCVMPMFHKTGLVPIKLSRDGGASFPFIGTFYVLPPHRAPAKVLLRDDVQHLENRWSQPWAEQLTLQWQFLNLTYNMNARVDINLWGYWEDADRSHFVKIDSIVTGQPNNGLYSFSPRSLLRKPSLEDAWRKFHFGFVQVAVSGYEDSGVLWSEPTPFSWYHLPEWERNYGENWATDMCIEWFEYDGRRRNFIKDLTWQKPCPCKMEQALLDLGSFMPLFECDRDGDTSCPFNKGAQHCVQTVLPSWTGGSQQCCYDYRGYLMFTDDWEPDGDYTRFFQPATPSRAHNFGSPPYKRPPFIPSMSHYQLDLLPYRTCCDYAKHCEFYYWRRQTNGCQDYRPPAAGYIYGEPHVITFDGTRYTFPGKGYYMLVINEDPVHRLTIQVRLEQPDLNAWRSNVNATVVTGVVIRENDSSVVQVFARKPMRRWRYRMDILVDGMPRYFDKPHWKYQQFQGVNIRNPRLNMNQSEVIIMLNSGAGVRVAESYGMLDIMVLLPPSFNSTCTPGGSQPAVGPSADQNAYGRRCYTTMGLLGTFNNDMTDDLMTIDGQTVRVSGDTHTRGTTQMIYEQFGQKWRLDSKKQQRLGPVLFQDRHKPIYNPLLFADPYYYPTFWPQKVPLNATLIFSLEEVKTACMGVPQCEYDYLMTGRREVGLTTLDLQQKFVGLQRRGSINLISCGPLLKKEGVIKTPPAQNYLDGDVVTFSCKPKYYIHGDIERRCINGTWSPGWWAWCRDRNLEYGLKWMTAILTIFGIVMLFVLLFCCCWMARRRRERQYTMRHGRAPTKMAVAQQVAGPIPEKTPLMASREGLPPPPRPFNSGKNSKNDNKNDKNNKGKMETKAGSSGQQSSSIDSYADEPRRVGGALTSRMVTYA